MDQLGLRVHDTRGWRNGPRRVASMPNLHKGRGYQTGMHALRHTRQLHGWPQEASDRSRCSRRPGHSSPTITLEIYTSAIPGADGSNQRGCRSSRPVSSSKPLSKRALIHGCPTFPGSRSLAETDHRQPDNVFSGERAYWSFGFRWGLSHWTMIDPRTRQLCLNAAESGSNDANDRRVASGSALPQQCDFIVAARSATLGFWELRQPNSCGGGT